MENNTYVLIIIRNMCLGFKKAVSLSWEFPEIMFACPILLPTKVMCELL